METSRLQWPIPDEHSSEWFDVFTALLEAQDAAVYAALEDRNVLFFTAATFIWDSALGVLEWDGPIYFISPGTGYRTLIAAGTVTILDGQLAHLPLTRSARSNNTVSLTASNTLNPTADVLALCGRVGSAIWFRNGVTIPASGTYAASELFGPAATGVNATSLRARLIATTVPSLGQVYAWSGTAWEPVNHAIEKAVSGTTIVLALPTLPAYFKVEGHARGASTEWFGAIQGRVGSEGGLHMSTAAWATGLTTARTCSTDGGSGAIVTIAFPESVAGRVSVTVF